MIRKILLIAAPALACFVVINNNYHVRAWAVDAVISVEHAVQQALNRNRR